MTLLIVFLLVGLAILALLWLEQAPKPVPKGPVPRNTFQNRAAVHEAGHAIVAWACTWVSTVDSVSIEEKDGGSTCFRLKSDDSPEEMWCNLVISLAGIAAEVGAFKRMHSTESKGDLVKSLALSEKLAKLNQVTPPWKVPEREKSLPFDKIFRSLDHDQKVILTHAYHVAHGVIDSHGAHYYKLVSLLLTKKTISSSDMESILGKRAIIKLIAWSFDPRFVLPNSL